MQQAVNSSRQDGIRKKLAIYDFKFFTLTRVITMRVELSCAGGVLRLL
jgi:hypothetical protein